MLPVAHGGTGTTNLEALLSAAGGAKIQTGSYIGTGTYGASNPNTLTFEFVPRFLYIYGGALTNLRSGFGLFVHDSPVEYAQTIYDEKVVQLSVTWGENSVMWYSAYSRKIGSSAQPYLSSDKSEQLNDTMSYYYVAIG